MKNLLILTLMAIIGYLVYPIYQQKQAESTIRDKLQNINISHIINFEKQNNDMTDDLLDFLKNNLIHIDTKNQYPSFQIKIVISDIKILDELSPLVLKNTTDLQKEYICQKLIDSFKNENNIAKQALINVLAKDAVFFDITLAKENGSKIAQYNHKAIDCFGIWATTS